MVAFIYYLPNITPEALTLDAVRERGLAHVLERAPGTKPKLTGDSPDGNHGVLTRANAPFPDQFLKYRPADQHWRKHPTRDHWIGWLQQNPPRPEELLRPENQLLDGHLVELGDGQRWMIPAARRFDESSERLCCALPQFRDLDEQTGEWTLGGMSDRDRKLWDIAERYFDTLADGAAERALVIDDCVTAIAANYRVDRLEIAVLRLLDDDSMQRIFQALIDAPTYYAWTKKKATADASIVAGSPSANGSRDVSRDTVQPSPT